MNVLDSVCIMTHAIVDKQETRKLREIVEIVNVTSDGTAITNTPFKWNSKEDQFYFKKESKLFEKISKRYGLSYDEIKLEFKKRALILYKLYENKIFDFEEVQNLINEYYKRPQDVLKKLGIE